MTTPKVRFGQPTSSSRVYSFSTICAQLLVPESTHSPCTACGEQHLDSLPLLSMEWCDLLAALSDKLKGAPDAGSPEDVPSTRDARFRKEPCIGQARLARHRSHKHCRQLGTPPASSCCWKVLALHRLYTAPRCKVVL